MELCKHSKMHSRLLNFVQSYPERLETLILPRQQFQMEITTTRVHLGHLQITGQPQQHPHHDIMMTTLRVAQQRNQAHYNLHTKL